jgi:hypothetical protein
MPEKNMSKKSEKPLPFPKLALKPAFGPAAAPGPGWRVRCCAASEAARCQSLPSTLYF